MMVCQKLGMILENKVVQKWKLENNVSTTKVSPKLIFLNVKKICRFLTSKIDFESMFLALFNEFYDFFPLSMLILGQKSCFLGPTIF